MLCQSLADRFLAAESLGISKGGRTTSKRRVWFVFGGLPSSSYLQGSMKSAEEEAYSFASPHVTVTPSTGMVNPSIPISCHGLQSSSPVASVLPSTNQMMGYGGNIDTGASSYYLTPNVRPNGAPTLESPRIEITPYPGIHLGHNQFTDETELGGIENGSGCKRSNSLVTLTLPNADAYRDPSCLSPASSLSSRSCHSEASESSYSIPYDTSPLTSPWQSPCVSPKGTAHEEGFARGQAACTLWNSPRHSPGTSPRTSITEENWLSPRPTSRPSSRPQSPCGKRRHSFNGGYFRQPSYSPHHSRTPSPQASPRVSMTEETWSGSGNQYNSAILAAITALTTDTCMDINDSIPVKSPRRTIQDQSPSMLLKPEPGNDEQTAYSPCGDPSQEEFSASRLLIKKETFCEQYLSVPQHPYPWSKPKSVSSSSSSFASPSLPALDWQLPSHSGPYELEIEVQPKSHHRAHYETEGSRGAVKASGGGHPIVQLHGYMESEPLTLQLFIGTADDRLLRPHAFYQVHRITGKTVSTSSHENIINNTKVLEIPLLPENNMRANIDCAGILKLRNSDIELRKGETDIGRKNTRVRLVFRVHIPQPNGRTISLQVSSNPIECSQRSAQELPLIEKQSIDRYPVIGGKMMILSGHNFLAESKVIFVEKAADGHHVWETEAKTDKEFFKPSSLIVEIPPYRNQRITSPVQVYFYVCNGKRKRSQSQRFSYLPANVPVIKTEPTDDYESALVYGSLNQGMNPVSQSYYSQQVMTPEMTPDPGSCLVSSFPSCQQRSTGLSSSPTSGHKQHEITPISYTKCVSSPTSAQLSHQQSGATVPTIQEVHRSVVVHPSSPTHSAHVMMQPQMNQHLNSSCSRGFQQTLYPNNLSPQGPSASPEAAYVQPFSPTNSAAMGQQQQAPKPPRNGSQSSQSMMLPVHQENSQDLTPLQITVKQEPQELDQLYLDDVNEIIRNDLSSASVHGHS
ncbi:nuclear factor of activated T-cells, cytoplasmic 1 isoform X2 [Hemiscyllium ocellatum]|uniref:nuclear factor of activated T-cells, cytoplasmic 1 isoform X2 n=2 Tax=Hemiscyllium ocellatum TaxID=170820 RepID=UPI00296697A9|nr:nuclear factor of activated T-cells, cytoplasmic 1 isoform X2 [Hemiscyllium ocellatum]